MATRETPNVRYVVVGVDESPPSVAALRWAAGYAAITHAELGAGVHALDFLHRHAQPHAHCAGPGSHSQAAMPAPKAKGIDT